MEVVDRLHEDLLIVFVGVHMFIPEQIFIHVEHLEDWIESDGLAFRDCSILYLHFDNRAYAPLKEEGRYEIHAVVREDK